ncbi:MAG TPA: hypothetical protein VGL56_20105 [Fimbriimonadaceae bacterium]
MDSTKPPLPPIGAFMAVAPFLSIIDTNSYSLWEGIKGSSAKE